MSAIKHHLDDLLDERRDKIMAEELGLSYSEYQQLDAEIDFQTDDDGNPRFLFVRVGENAPDALIAKATHKLEEGRYFDLDPWLFSNYATDHEGEDK